MKFEKPFYFLRHGETVWNREKICQGQSESQLNEAGVEQAHHAAEILKSEPIERIVASPLIRVRDTAKVVADKLNLDVIFDDGLKECHLGEMQGKSRGEWLADYWTHNFDPPGGERFSEFSSRVWEAMARAVELGPNTLIIAHGGLWIAAQEFIRVEPGLMPMPNALPVHVIPDGKVWNQRVLDPARVSDHNASSAIAMP